MHKIRWKLSSLVGSLYSKLPSPISVIASLPAGWAVPRYLSYLEMRQFSTAALLLLLLQLAQGPSLTQGRPIPITSAAAGPGEEEYDSVAPLTQVTLRPITQDGIDSGGHGTTRLLAPARDGEHSQDDLLEEESSPCCSDRGTDPDSNLGRELAELALLRDQLASLASEIEARERRLLAEAGGGWPPPPGLGGSVGILDCDGLGCVARTVLGRLAAAAAAIFDSDHGDEPHHPLESGADGAAGAEIPVSPPPWRAPAAAINHTAATRYRYESDAGAADGCPVPSPGLALVALVALLLLVPAALLRPVISRVMVRGGGGSYDAFVDGPSTMAGPAGWRGRREGEDAGWDRLWQRDWRGFGHPRQPGRGEEWRLGRAGESWAGQGGDYRDGDGYGYGYGYGDEKRWLEDEKDARMFEEESEEDSRPEADDGGEGDDEEPLTLAEEIASFRAVADMVGDIIAAEEARARGR